MKSESPSSTATASRAGGAALDPAECAPPITACMPICVCMHAYARGIHQLRRRRGSQRGFGGKLLTHGVNSCSRCRQCFVKRGTTAERDEVSEASQCLACVYASRGCETNARRDPGRTWRNKVKRRQACGERLGGCVPVSGRYAVE